MDSLPRDMLRELVGWLGITDALAFTATCAHCHSVKEAAWKPRRAEDLGRSVLLRGRFALSLGSEGEPNLALPTDWKVSGPVTPEQVESGAGGYAEPFIRCCINDMQTYCIIGKRDGRYIWFTNESKLDICQLWRYSGLAISELSLEGWALTGGHNNTLGTCSCQRQSWYTSDSIEYDSALSRALWLSAGAVRWRIFTGCVVRASDIEQKLFVAGAAFRQPGESPTYYVGFVTVPSITGASFARLPGDPLGCAWLPERQAALLLTRDALYVARQGAGDAPVDLARLPSSPRFSEKALSLRVGATKVVVVDSYGKVAVLSRTTLRPLYTLDFSGPARVGLCGKVARGVPGSGQVLLFPYLEAGTEDGARPDRLRLNAGPERGEGSYYHYVWDL